MKFPRGRAAPWCVAIGLFAPACGNGDDGAGNSAAELDFTLFDGALAQFVSDHGLRGASAVVVHEERGVVHAAGYGEYAANRIYLIASSSKILSMGVLMRLADQGVLDLDAPIGTYLSSWGEGKAELTLAQLVSGSSGLVGIVDNFVYPPYICQANAAMTLADCAKTIYTADDTADRISPDTEFHYGGAAWQLAGGVAEAASGKPWAELFRETYEPCGLSSTAYTNATALMSFTPDMNGSLTLRGMGYPKTFDGNVAVLPVTDNPNIEGGAHSAADDYGKVLLMHLRGGTCGNVRVLSEAAVTTMRKDRIASYEGSAEQQLRAIILGATDATLQELVGLSGYGMGWWVSRRQPGVFHDPGAFGSAAWIDEERGYAAFVGIEGHVLLGAELAVAAETAADAAFDAGR
jgi:CubicO group peptidase (beta-lactamase class C family)